MELPTHMGSHLWWCLTNWQNLYRAARAWDFPWMLGYARKLEGWNPKEVTYHIEENPPRIIVSLDGQPEIIISKKLFQEMIKQPIILLRWVRKYSYGKSMWE